jgi:hypothetical protein
MRGLTRYVSVMQYDLPLTERETLEMPMSQPELAKKRLAANIISNVTALWNHHRVNLAIKFNSYSGKITTR